MPLPPAERPGAGRPTREQADKEALFRATIRRAVERWTVPIDALGAVETADLREP